MTDIPNQTNHIEEHEETIQNVDVIKRPRGRPNKYVIPVEKNDPKVDLESTLQKKNNQMEKLDEKQFMNRVRSENQKIQIIGRLTIRM